MTNCFKKKLHSNLTDETYRSTVLTLMVNCFSGSGAGMGRGIVEDSKRRTK